MTHKTRIRAFFPLLAGGALLATLPTLTPQIAHAQDAKPDVAPAKADDTIPLLWAIQYTKGSVKQTRVNATITSDAGMGPFTIGFRQTQKRLVKEVKPTGGAIIEITQLSQTIVFNDQPIPEDADKHPVTTLTLDKNGQLLDYKTTEELQGGDTSLRLAALLAIVPVPDKPVKIGDSWTTEYSNKMLGKQKVTITYTLLGREVIFGKPTLKIKAQGQLPSGEDGKDSTKINAVINLEPDKANIVRASFKMENVDLPNPGGGTIKGNMEAVVEQIIPGVNDKEETKK